MSSVRDVIKSAYRRSGVKAAGANITAVEYNTGIERLQAMYDKMVSDGLFGRFTDKRLTSATAYEAKERERVYNPSGAVVTYPTSVLDCISGLTRTPLDGTIISVIVPGSDPEIKIWDAFRGEWQATKGLTLSSFAPMTSMFDDAIKNFLAVVLADDVGNPVSPLLAKQASTAKLSLSNRYASPRRASTDAGSFM
jgi:hypothetical protein